jgi:cytidylate kinase
MTVITISRQFGSGGDEVTSRVCSLLGYKQFDKHMIAQTAQDAGLSENEIVDYTEDHHKIRSFLDRLLGVPDSVVNASSWKKDPTGAWYAEETKWIDDAAVSLMQKVILSAYPEGNLVIVGRGGQIILKDKPGVLHVRIEAPLEDRIQRVKQQLKETNAEFAADLEARREAQDLILQKDAASRDYIQSYYHAEWSNPLLYHTILNMGKFTVEQAAQAVAALVQVMEAEKINY